MPKKYFIFVSMLTFSSLVFAGGFVGKMGPYYEKSLSVRTFHFKICNPSLRSVTFTVAQVGRHYHPRFKPQSLNLYYSDNSVEVIDVQALGETRGFNVQLKNEGVYLTEVRMEAESAGYSPAGSLPTWVNLWGY